MNKIAYQFTSIDQVADQYLNPSKSNITQPEQGASFAEVLKEKQKAADVSEVKFSKHASMRLSTRNISLSDQQSERLEAGVEMAEKKGIKESLVVVDSLAFIVNVPSRTVVTAMDQNESENNVFTNIDGAVIA